MTAKELFGTNLRARRKACNLSQEELAEKANVSAKHIGALESGKSFVSADLLDTFSALLHVPVAAFFCEPKGDAAFSEKYTLPNNIAAARRSLAVLQKYLDGVTEKEKE